MYKAECNFQVTAAQAYVESYFGLLLLTSTFSGRVRYGHSSSIESCLLKLFFLTSSWHLPVSVSLIVPLFQHYADWTDYSALVLPAAYNLAVGDSGRIFFPSPGPHLRRKHNRPKGAQYYISRHIYTAARCLHYLHLLSGNLYVLVSQLSPSTLPLLSSGPMLSSTILLCLAQKVSMKLPMRLKCEKVSLSEASENQWRWTFSLLLWG